MRPTNHLGACRVSLMAIPAMSLLRSSSPSTGQCSDVGGLSDRRVNRSTRPLLRHGTPLRRALKLALVADTASIAMMELMDNAFILTVPGAINAGLNTVLFWLSLALSLAVAFACAFPLNRFLIARGKGHAVVHSHH